MKRPIALSDEQERALGTSGDLKLQAFAGSGKSTVLFHYIKRNHLREKILYLSYSRDNRDSFAEKCSQAGLTAEVKTFHSIALRSVFGNSRVKVEEKGSHTTAMMKAYLSGELGRFTDKLQNILAFHAKALMSEYCKTTLKKLDEFDYLSLLSPDSATALKPYEGHLYGLAQAFGTKMHVQQIPVTHDYYLKLFHNKGIVLPFDTILVDEVQDTSLCALDSIASQPACRKIYAGDIHQDIYGWRGTSRAMSNLDCQQLYLTESYRFGPGISLLANKLLALKNQLKGYSLQGEVIGKGPNASVQQEAIISRTIAGVIEKGIEIIEKKVSAKISYLGGLRHYIYHENGGGLLDVISLYNGRKPYDTFISTFDSFEDFEHYAIQTEDHAYINYVKIAKKYGRELPRLFSALSERVKKVDHLDADLVLTTAHRAKGCEYKHIMICADFQDVQKIIKLPVNRRPTDETINEEINVCYTAVTRAAERVTFDENFCN
jgi:hypothetical protein